MLVTQSLKLNHQYLEQKLEHIMKEVITQHKNIFIETTALTCAYGLALYLGVKFVMAIV